MKLRVSICSPALKVGTKISRTSGYSNLKSAATDKISTMKIKQNTTAIIKIYRLDRKAVSETKTIQEDTYTKTIFLSNRDSSQDTSDFIIALFHK